METTKNYPQELYFAANGDVLMFEQQKGKYVEHAFWCADDATKFLKATKGIVNFKPVKKLRGNKMHYAVDHRN